MKGYKVIAIAYACEPHRGSEPGIGWNIVREVARDHRVWVITRANNRRVIEEALSEDPEPNLHPVYFDLPGWARWWKRGPRGVQLYYYLWQVGAYRRAEALHRKEGFDVAHHVTFGRYWSPSCLALLPIPLVWGPLGGGESAPVEFWKDFSFRGGIYEATRSAARWLGEHDPFVLLTARRCSTALPTTAETAARLRRLKVAHAELLGNAALNRRELRGLAAMSSPPTGPIRFISMGRLLHWKGFHLGLRAFGRAALPGAEYWIVGDGPERRPLQDLAESAGIAHQVRFLGRLSRGEALAQLERCHALVHPSLHDSGGWVCIEAMAAGRPVVCLDLGGPAVLVSEGTGFKVEAYNPVRAVAGLAEAMVEMAADPALRAAMGERAKDRAEQLFTWEYKAARIRRAYTRAVESARGRPVLSHQP